MKKYIEDLILIHYNFNKSQMVQVDEAIVHFLAELDDILHWNKEDQDKELLSKPDYE